MKQMVEKRRLIFTARSPRAHDRALALLSGINAVNKGRAKVNGVPGQITATGKPDIAFVNRSHVLHASAPRGIVIREGGATPLPAMEAR
jgi:hypothetical protein